MIISFTYIYTLNVIWFCSGGTKQKNTCAREREQPITALWARSIKIPHFRRLLYGNWAIWGISHDVIKQMCNINLHYIHNGWKFVRMPILDFRSSINNCCRLSHCTNHVVVIGNYCSSKRPTGLIGFICLQSFRIMPTGVKASSIIALGSDPITLHV